MADANTTNGTGDESFLKELENGIVKIIRGGKNSKADKIAAINAGVRLAAIRHKITSGDQETGFFDK